MNWYITKGLDLPQLLLSIGVLIFSIATLIGAISYSYWVSVETYALLILNDL